MKIQNFINDQFCEPVSGKYLDNVNPSTGTVYGTLPDSGAEDAIAAIEAAKEAAPAWAALSKEARAEHLLNLASLIKENEHELAMAESTDQGKPYNLSSKVDIPRSSSNLEFFAGQLKDFNSVEFNSAEFGDNEVSYNPLGVVCCISPWNLPLYLLTWKIAPALAAGNTVVAKPSEVTPATAYLFSKLVKESSLPKGVLNIIHGTGAKLGETLTTHPDVKAVSFTGSTATGRIINQSAASSFKKVSLEMGGKNPNIIFADCDLKKAVSITMRSTFTNQGEVCTCGSRIFVERSIYNEFRDALVAKANKLVIGDPLDSKTQHGAMVSKDHYEKVLSYIDLARELGGTVLCGGGPAELSGDQANGYFIKPTLIEGLDPYCRVNQEEIFGPVATLTPFDSEEEVIEWANSTEYGLAGTVHTEDLEKGKRIASKIDSGMLWVNNWMLRDLRTPFGGVKNSGVGREGGQYALKFFSQMKNICLS
jgi:aminomuconate-semialdehyde/2-hydroxymuconate-6-semialdehyde dehydrogenase